MPTTCVVPSCSRRVYLRSYCKVHFDLYKRSDSAITVESGTPSSPKPKKHRLRKKRSSKSVLATGEAGLPIPAPNTTSSSMSDDSDFALSEEEYSTTDSEEEEEETEVEIEVAKPPPDPSVPRKCVSFGNVEFREYKRQIAASSVPAREGPPLGLSWDVLKQHKISVKEHERLKGRRLRAGLFEKKGVIPVAERLRLLENAGHRRSSIEESVSSVKLILEQRGETAESESGIRVIRGEDPEEVQRWEALHQQLFSELKRVKKPEKARPPLKRLNTALMNQIHDSPKAQVKSLNLSASLPVLEKGGLPDDEKNPPMSGRKKDLKPIEDPLDQISKTIHDLKTAIDTVDVEISKITPSKRHLAPLPSKLEPRISSRALLGPKPHPQGTNVMRRRGSTGDPLAYEPDLPPKGGRIPRRSMDFRKGQSMRFKGGLSRSPSTSALELAKQNRARSPQRKPLSRSPSAVNFRAARSGGAVRVPRRSAGSERALGSTLTERRRSHHLVPTHAPLASVEEITSPKSKEL